MASRLFQSIANYEAKLRLGAAGRLSEAEIRRRVENYGMRAAQEAAVLVQVRQVLCHHGITPWVFPMYHAYARELGRLRRQDCPAAARREMLSAIAAKWVARGLDQVTLLAVASCVFNLCPTGAAVRLQA